MTADGFLDSINKKSSSSSECQVERSLEACVDHWLQLDDQQAGFQAWMERMDQRVKQFTETRPNLIRKRQHLQEGEVSEGDLSFPNDHRLIKKEKKKLGFLYLVQYLCRSILKGLGYVSICKGIVPNKKKKKEMRVFIFSAISLPKHTQSAGVYIQMYGDRSC
jgi:hypothetical protein